MFLKKFKIFIYLFLGLTFSILVVGFKAESVMAVGLNTDYVKVTVEHTPAGPPTAHNVFGWAWSDNIGWISFTCDNPEFPNCTNDFGVDIDENTGIFSGYAWSDNIGWISFNETELTGCPSGTCRAELNFSTNEVSGWTKTVNTGDGWDGWIKLRDDAVYANGVSLNDSTNEFEGWAWSDDFGWISFNCIEDGTCVTSDYRVSYSPPPNQPPTCTSLSTVPTPAKGVTPLDVSFTGVGSDSDGTIVQYQFDFGEGPLFTSANNTADHTYNSAGTYCSKLRVQDDDGAWSTTPGDCPDVCTEEIVVEINNPPTAAFSCDPDPATCGTSGCTGYTGCLFRLENQSTDPEGAGDIASSTWVITGPTSERITCTLNPLCDWPLQPIHPAGNYTATLTVEDQPGYKDISASQNFTIYQEAIADFMCSLTNEDGSWQGCATISVSEGEVVYFKDDLSAPNPHSSPSEGATAIISRAWEKSEDGGPFILLSSDNKSNSSTTLGQGSAAIRLTITDNNSVTGQRTVVNNDYTVGVKAPLPEWKEVSPFQ